MTVGRAAAGCPSHTPCIFRSLLEGLGSSLAKQHSAMSIGLEVHPHIKLQGLVMKVLDASGGTGHLDTLVRLDRTQKAKWDDVLGDM